MLLRVLVCVVRVRTSNQLLDLPNITYQGCRRLVEWVWFDRIILLLIAANCVVLAVEGPDVRCVVCQ